MMRTSSRGDGPRGGGRATARPRRTGSRAQERAAYLLLAPALLTFAVFMAYPVFEGVKVSFFDYTPFNEVFVGLDNYTRLLGDERVRAATVHTAGYAFATTALTLVLGLALALALDARIAARTYTRTVAFIPFVLSMAVISISFVHLLDPDLGWVSYALQSIGFPHVAVLRDPTTAMIAVILVGVWKTLGYYAVILLAGLQNVPEDVLEAARVDGVSRWQEIWRIKIPLLANSLMIVSVLALIAGLQVFDQIYVMTAGGPYGSTESLVGVIFERGFKDYQMGYASAIAVVFTVVVAALSVAQIRFFSHRLVRG